MPLHIDLFMPHKSRYNVLHHFTEKLSEALERQNQICRLLTLDSNNKEEFLNALIQTPPDCTLSFNALEPDSSGTFLCDMLKIPHVCCLVDSANTYFSLAKESIDTLNKTHYSILTSVDRDSCNILREIGVKNVFFLPHAVDKELSGDVEAERPYDVVSFASPIDYVKERNSWEMHFPGSVVKALAQAAELALSNPNISYIRAFSKLFKLTHTDGTITPEIVKHATALNTLERYIRGIDRINVIKSVKSAKVDVFGTSQHGTSWGQFLNGLSNVQIHDSVPFDKTLHTMKNSKIILNSCSWIRDGGHERIFSAMACGALVITTRTPFLEESFFEGEEILFYDLNEWHRINELVEYYMSHHDERKNIALQGQKKVLQHHTWDNRAKVLIERLPLILENM